MRRKSWLTVIRDLTELPHLVRSLIKTVEKGFMIMADQLKDLNTVLDSIDKAVSDTATEVKTLISDLNAAHSPQAGVDLTDAIARANNILARLQTVNSSVSQGTTVDLPQVEPAPPDNTAEAKQPSAPGEVDMSGNPVDNSEPSHPTDDTKPVDDTGATAPGEVEGSGEPAAPVEETAPNDTLSST